jgi:uncharacterized heparinase superfamily protein
MLKKYYHTIRQLEYIQIRYRIYYLVKRKVYEKLGSKIWNRYLKKYKNQEPKVNLAPDFFPHKRFYYSSQNLDELFKNSFTFLNQKKDFGEKILWNATELNTGTRLWKLNLHYHEFLIDVALNFEKSNDKLALTYLENTITDWIENNPIGTKDYGKDNWNSYALSLRIVSWIKIFKLLNNEFSETFKVKFIENLWIQGKFLSDNPEFDILGNHLVKNWKALIYLSNFFNDSLFLKQANTIFDKYIEGQFSPSGMHEEMSPMYAGIVLEDLLEVYNLNPTKRLEKICINLNKCVGALSHQNEYLFFNDSVNNNGVGPIDLKKLFFKVFNEAERDPSTSIINFDGFLGVKKQDFHFVFDGGQPVLGHQPGHLQCDSLSFELFYKGVKVFSNTGTYEYSQGSRRTYSRSTKSHNTLQIGNFEQSEIWSSFRVGRKANVNYFVKELSAENFSFSADLKGFNFGTNESHYRDISFNKNILNIEDSFESELNEKGTIYFHFGKDIQIKVKPYNNLVLDIYHKTTKLGWLKVSDNVKFEVLQTPFYPEFGLEYEKSTLVLKNLNAGEKIISTITLL